MKSHFLIVIVAVISSAAVASFPNLWDSVVKSHFHSFGRVRVSDVMLFGSPLPLLKLSHF